MIRKLASLTLAITGLLMLLGAFGHSFMGRKALDVGIARVALDTHTEKLVYLVWYFCGGCMLVFGLLVIASAWRAWRGEDRGLRSSASIGMFYLVTGVLSLAYMREAFWSVFVILGGLALVSSLTIATTGSGLRQRSTAPGEHA